MARYVDIDELIKISKEDKFIWAYDLTDLEEFLSYVPSLDLVPRADVDKAILESYLRGKRDIVNEIQERVLDEITEAKLNNFEVIKELEVKRKVNRYEDPFCSYCYGQIHALDGMYHVISELLPHLVKGD